MADKAFRLGNMCDDLVDLTIELCGKGNTHNMVLAMDDYLNGLLAPLDMHMRMQYSGRKKLKTGQWRKKWRVVIEPALKGEINIEQNNS